MEFRQLVFPSILGLIITTVVLLALSRTVRASHWLVSLLSAAGLGWLVWWITAVLSANPPEAHYTIATAVIATAICAALFEDWTSIGHLAYAGTAIASAAFLLYAGDVLSISQLGPWSMTFGVILWLLQALAHLLVLTHTFEILDVICRKRWRRLAVRPSAPASYRPKVSLHVPTHNEPPELVRETLNALAQLDYEDFEVLVVDNNTDTESLWRPIEDHCRTLGPRFRFFHVAPWPGYKSGALNFALAQTSSEVEVIGVVDADYIVEPDFLRELTPYFSNPSVAFVQTPQDYRDSSHRGRYGRALYLAYRVFFDISMPSRNERNAIIYAGTMGLIRRSAIEQAGGWDEWCITEDAELSLRLLDDGYEAIYDPRAFGRGLMPLDFAGLKKQRFRWAFGGMQILRLHGGLLLNPFRKSNLTVAQRAGYLIGGLQWLNDPLTLAFTLLLLIGSGGLVFGGSMYLQPLAGAAIFVPTLFVLISVLRFLWAFHLVSRCTLREAFDAMTVLLGLTWVVTLACVQGSVRRHGVFLRTPKVAEQPRVTDIARVSVFEVVIGLLCLSSAVAVGLTAAPDAFGITTVMSMLLLWQTLIYFSAFRTSLWSYLAHPERAPRTRWLNYHTAGPRRAPMLAEWRTAVWVVAISGLLVGLFIMALWSAPLMEQIFRKDPLREFVFTSSLTSNVRREPPESAAGTLLLREAESVIRRDVDAILKLWHPDGIIQDHNFTPGLDFDDSYWRGPTEIRNRYTAELAARSYLKLKHRNLVVNVADGRAVIENDLLADVETGSGRYEIELPMSDRWTLDRGTGEWRIVRLELNRAAGAESRGTASAGRLR